MKWKARNDPASGITNRDFAKAYKMVHCCKLNIISFAEKWQQIVL